MSYLHPPARLPLSSHRPPPEAAGDERRGEELLLWSLMVATQSSFRWGKPIGEGKQSRGYSLVSGKGPVKQLGAS